MNHTNKAEELLRQHEDNVLWIKKRYFFLKSFLQVLDKRVLGGRFEIANDTVYQMIHDSYDMLAIDLASLCRGMVQKGGFFNKLNNHLSELKLAKESDIKVPKGNVIYTDEQPTEQEVNRIEEGIRQNFASIVLDHNESAFFELFPLAKDRSQHIVTQEDVQLLKDRFFKMAEALIQDRDGNRAHRFENSRKNRSSEVPKQTVDKIGDVFDEIERILNSVRLITNHSTFGYSDMNSCSVEATSKDLIDFILLGTSVQIQHFFGTNDKLRSNSGRYYWQHREDFYEELHTKFYEVHKEVTDKVLEEYMRNGDYSTIKFPDIPINKVKPGGR